jgi:outer membrane protein OmpA-like peptidoglycan-associated protein
MRPLPLLAALAALLFAGAAAGEPPPTAPEELQAQERKLPPLKMLVERSKVDLAARRLEVKMSRTAEMVRIKVFDEMGDELTDEQHDFSGRRAGTPLVVRWKQKNDEPVAKIEVYGHDVHGYWTGVAIVPWSLEIPHQEVHFDTDKADIKPEEEPKLEESYERVVEAIKKYEDLGAIKLYVAGHTDTMGSPAHNMDLSRRRARSIGAWFKKRGIKVPVFYEGFGESSLAVKTEDEVDEPRNRRVDYILAVEPPALKSGGNAAWKKL